MKNLLRKLVKDRGLPDSGHHHHDGNSSSSIAAVDPISTPPPENSTSLAPDLNSSTPLPPAGYPDTGSNYAAYSAHYYNQLGSMTQPPTAYPYVPQDEGAQHQHPTVRRVIKTGGNHNKKGTQKTGGVKAVLSSALPEEIITGDNINEGDNQMTEGVTLDRDGNIVE